MELGELLVRSGIGLVYGGGSVGLMGDVADAVLRNNGDVIGVIPEALATKELLHPGVVDMRVVDTMHTRKALMAELADAFITLPGGLGTLEEFFETLTWSQLGIHRKPIALLNTNGYFDPLLAMVEHAVSGGFVSSRHRRLFVVAEQPEDLWQAFADHSATV